METRLLNENLTVQLRQVFTQLVEPVEVLFFGSKEACESCDDTLQLVSELTDLDDRLTLSVYDVENNREVARQHRVDKFPGLVIVGRDGDSLIDYGIRYAGIPSGLEFSSLVHSLLLVSSRDSGLTDQTRDFLKGISKPVLLQVFVTPT